MAAPEIDSAEGIKIGDVLIHDGEVTGITTPITVGQTEADVTADNETKDSNITPSDVLIIENIPCSHTVNTTGYVEVYSFRVKTGVLSATCRCVFNLRTVAAGGTAYGRVYLDYAAIGTEQSTTSTSSVNFSEDLDLVGAGHVVSLYLKTSSGHNAHTNSFKIKGDAFEIATSWQEI